MNNKTYQPIAVVVDAYGAAKSYPHYFRQLGVKVIHLQSTPTLLPALTAFDVADYDSAIIHHSNDDETIAHLKQAANTLKGEIVCIIPGVEPGVLLADAMSEKMGLIGNGIALSLARRDKYEMAKVLHAAGISIPNFAKFSTLDDVLNYASTQAHWPLVIKPLNSAGCNGVFICKDTEALRHAYGEIIGKTNNMGTINQEVIVQSFLKGQEYMVNSVSCNGQHYFTDIWHAKKFFLENRGFIYDRNELLSADTSEAQQLMSYVQTVLDALGIQYGPAHAEVMMTEDGPKLIEIGARVSGLVVPDYNDALLGHNQVALAVDAYIRPEYFLSKTTMPYQIKQYGMQVCLVAQKSGQIRAIPFHDQLESLSSLFSYSLKIKEGGFLHETIDLSSSPGVCNLSHDDWCVLEQDYAALRKYFAEGVALDDYENSVVMCH